MSKYKKKEGSIVIYTSNEYWYALLYTLNVYNENIITGGEKVAIGANIKILRIHRKLSQEDLSKITKIPQSIISRYEKETIIPPIPKLEKIAEALQVKISELLEM